MKATQPTSVSTQEHLPATTNNNDTRTKTNVLTNGGRSANLATSASTNARVAATSGTRANATQIHQTAPELTADSPTPSTMLVTLNARAEKGDKTSVVRNAKLLLGKTLTSDTQRLRQTLPLCANSMKLRSNAFLITGVTPKISVYSQSAGPQ